LDEVAGDLQGDLKADVVGDIVATRNVLGVSFTVLVGPLGVGNVVVSVLIGLAVKLDEDDLVLKFFWVLLHNNSPIEWGG